MAEERVLNRLAPVPAAVVAGTQSARSSVLVRWLRPGGLRLGRCAHAALLGLVLCHAWPEPAPAHGAASWIMRDPDHGWCCGPEDCFSIERRDVHIDRDDYVVDRLAVRWPIVGTFRSIDDRYWICYFMRGSRFEQVKCFFAPRPPAM